MIKCKYCRGEMEKRYSFTVYESVQKFRCPNCGAETVGKPIEYDENGRLTSRKKSNRENK